MKNVEVWIKDLSDRWEQIGTGSWRGIRPADMELTSDTWGPKQASFNLLREAWVAWPDIQAYAEVDIWVGGRLTWSGRVVEAPTDEAARSVSVRCEGWQAHLDDDQYTKYYIHTDLTKFVDIRSHIDAPLTYFTTNGITEIGNGIIKLGWPKGTPMAVGERVGALLDLGPDGESNGSEITVRRGAGTPSLMDFYLRTADTVDQMIPGGTNYTASWGPYTVNGLSDTSSTRLSAGLAGHRYVLLWIVCTGAYTPTLDDMVIVDSVNITSGSYYDYTTNHASVLTGPGATLDALGRASTKFSLDHTKLDSTSAASEFYIPEFAPDGPRTPRQIIESTNAFYDYLTKVDEQRVVHYRPRPTVPKVRVGRWGASTFNDASASSATDVYNKVIASGPGPRGDDIVVRRHAGEQTGAQFGPVDADTGSPTMADPSLSTGTNGSAHANWLGSTYDTSTYVSAPGSIKYNSSLWYNFAGGAPGSSSGSFLPGVTYRLTFFAKAASGTPSIDFAWGNFGRDWVNSPSSGNVYPNSIPLTLNTTWTQYSILWTPVRNNSAASVSLGFGTSPGGVYISFDDFVIEASTATVIDKRGFTRAHTLDSGFMLTQTSAARLADLYILAHRAMPFKGSGQVVGASSLRGYASGDPVQPEELLRMTGELVHFEDAIDPDTGNVGRDGRVVNVTYRPETDTATFDIDNTRGDFDSLLSRVGVKVGQVRV